jgi:hypothetical protein
MHTNRIDLDRVILASQLYDALDNVYAAAMRDRIYNSIVSYANMTRSPIYLRIVNIVLKRYHVSVNKYNNIMLVLMRKSYNQR